MARDVSYLLRQGLENRNETGLSIITIIWWVICAAIHWF